MAGVNCSVLYSIKALQYNDKHNNVISTCTVEALVLHGHLLAKCPKVIRENCGEQVVEIATCTLSGG